MRPLNLTLAGFTAFKEPAELDFERLHLFALSGPNGAGKSSLLEAILFALFGEAPRLRGKESISHGRDELRIALQFQVDDKIYRVGRRYFRDKSTGQARLELKMDGELWRTLTDKVGETNKAIERLLGMNYDTFTKAVILPQNLFDQFLKGDKENRRQVLDNLLSLKLFEKAATLAGEQSRVLRERLRQDELLLSELRDKTGEAGFEALRAQLENLQSEGVKLTERKKVLAKEIAETEKMMAFIQEKESALTSLQSQIRGSEKELELFTKEFSQLEKASTEINRRFESELPQQKEKHETLLSLRPMMARYQKLLDEEKEKNKEWIRFNEEVKAFESELPRLKKAVNDFQLQRATLRGKREELEKTDDRFLLLDEHITELQTLGSLYEENKKLIIQKNSLHQEHDKMSRAIADVTPKMKELENKINEQKKTNEEIQRGSRVSELRQTLAAGSPCPVCSQTVHAIPSPIRHDHAPVDLAPLEKEHRKLLEQSGHLKGSLGGLSKEMERLETRLNENQKESGALETRLSRLFGYPAEELLAKAREEYKALKEARAKLNEIRRSEEILSKESARCQEELDVRANQLVSADKQRLALRTLLDRLSQEKNEFEKNRGQAGLSSLTAAEVEKQITESERWIRKLTEEKETTLRKFHQVGERLKISTMQIEKLHEQENAEKEALKTVPVERPVLESRFKSSKEDLCDLEPRLESIQLETGKAKQQLAYLEDAREKMKVVEERSRVTRKEETLCVTLHHDLQKNKLPDFLFSAVLSRLLEMAGEKFAEFSGGRYQLSLEGTGEIQVLDGWNNDLPRPIESLSGGEVFAASLAFALALSEYLQGRQRIQCLFIDEGFGNLDRETRDKVAEILARLETKDKLIGIVTHIEELAELFPERVWIEKMPEGSRIVQGERDEANAEPGRISVVVA